MFIGVYLIMVFDPQILFNDGFYPLLHVVIPSGSLLHPKFPSALGCRTHALSRLFDVLGGALARKSPEHTTAAGYGTSPYMLYSGWDDRGDFFYLMEISYGGIPGRPIGDGMDGHSWWPLFQNIPTEYLEAYYPVRIDGYTTVVDSGGAGFHRGGNGIEKRYVYLEPGRGLDPRRPLAHLSMGHPRRQAGHALGKAPPACRRHHRAPPFEVRRGQGRAGRRARLPDRRRRRLEGSARPAGGAGRSRRRQGPRVEGEGGKRLRRRRRRCGGDRVSFGHGSARSVATSSTSTSARPSTRSANARRRRPGSRRRCRPSRLPGRQWSRGEDALARVREKGDRQMTLSEAE